MRLKNLKQKIMSGFSCAALSLFMLPSTATAQDVSVTDDVLVTASRTGSGIVGVSSTIITEEDIQRSPANTIQGLLSREAGIQVRSLFGSTAGSRDVVDMRGFGASATSNTLILLNGRRLNDLDLTSVDFTAISKDSISRIEILRGGSGGVLYGDGAQGGVINIVTKAATDLPDIFKLESKIGSHEYFEENLFLRKTVGNTTAVLTGTAIDSNGYRLNNELSQINIAGELRTKTSWGSAYLNVTTDQQSLGLPGSRGTFLNTLGNDRRGTSTPTDYAKTQGVSAVVGGTYELSDQSEIIVDGGVRRKAQQACLFCQFTGGYIDTTLMTYSFTPRYQGENAFMSNPGRLKTGLDLYYVTYDSDRQVNQAGPNIHDFDIEQTSVSIYAQQSVDLSPNTSISFGGRLQYVNVHANNSFTPGLVGFPSPAAEIPSHDKGEIEYALHFGAEQQVYDDLKIFGRLSRSIRVPNVDERVGSGGASFDLEIQKSYDAEVGVKFNDGILDFNSSLYFMRLKDEIHFVPTFGGFGGSNINLDSTERYGFENSVGYRLTDDIKIKGNLNYTRAKFVKGTFSGNDVSGNDIPLVSRWTGGAGISWNLIDDLVILDADIRYIGRKRFDNDQISVQPFISGHTLADVKIGGSAESLGWIDKVSWSFGVENIFNKKYYNYGIASATTIGAYNAFPQPGRTYMGSLKLEF